MANRLAIGGAIAEVVLARAMERALGEVGRPYREGPAGLLSKLATALLLAGAGAVAAGATRPSRGRPAERLGAVGVLAGTLAERLAVWRAGTESAKLTVR